MPTKPPTPCTYPGCPNLARGRGSRCPDHAYDRLRGSASRRGYGGRRWQTVRAYVIERDGGRCQDCGAEGARQVAHIVDRRAGGSDDPSNLRLLCDSCHSRETARETGFGRPPADPSSASEGFTSSVTFFSCENCEGADVSIHRPRQTFPRREIGEIFSRGRGSR